MHVRFTVIYYATRKKSICKLFCSSSKKSRIPIMDPFFIFFQLQI